MDKYLKELLHIMSQLTPENRKAVLKRARRNLRRQIKKSRLLRGGKITKLELSNVAR